MVGIGTCYINICVLLLVKLTMPWAWYSIENTCFRDGFLLNPEGEPRSGKPPKPRPRRPPTLPMSHRSPASAGRSGRSLQLDVGDEIVAVLIVADRRHDTFRTHARTTARDSEEVSSEGEHM